MSSTLPPPLRAAAGLAAKAVEEARRLPNRLVSLPVVAVGAAMQLSMRAQQEYAELVSRGDELITALRGNSDGPPPWAQFDEDAGARPDSDPGGPAGNGDGPLGPLLAPPGIAPSSFDLVHEADAVTDPSVAPDLVETELETVLLAATDPPDAAPIPGYDAWTVAQLRARLRRLTNDQLEELLNYERASRQRPPYLTMLENRLAGPRRG